MKLKIISTLLGLLLFGMGTATLANPIISWTPSFTELTGPGQYATLDLVGDFRSDPTKGGSIELGYLPTVLNYVDFTWNWTADDPQSRVVVNTPGVDDANPSVLTISFSNLDGISVNDTIGTLTFVSLNYGGTTLRLRQDSLYSSISPYPQQTLTYHTAVVIVTPLPGSVWLLGSALLGFVVVRRRRKIIALLRQ